MASVPSENEQRVSTVAEIDEETLRKIGEALQNWDVADPAARAELEKTMHDSDALIDQMLEAVAASERLSEEDLAIRINTRD